MSYSQQQLIRQSMQRIYNTPLQRIANTFANITATSTYDEPTTVFRDASNKYNVRVQATTFNGGSLVSLTRNQKAYGAAAWSATTGTIAGNTYLNGQLPMPISVVISATTYGVTGQCAGPTPTGRYLFVAKTFTGTISSPTNVAAYVWTSDDNCSTWTLRGQLDTTSMTNWAFSGNASWHTGTGRWYIHLRGPGGAGRIIRVFASDDQGVTWTNLGDAYNGTLLYTESQLFVFEEPGDTTATTALGLFSRQNTGTGLMGYKSTTDGGTTWGAFADCLFAEYGGTADWVDCYPCGTRANGKAWMFLSARGDLELKGIYFDYTGANSLSHGQSKIVGPRAYYFSVANPADRVTFGGSNTCSLLGDQVNGTGRIVLTTSDDTNGDGNSNAITNLDGAISG